MSTDPEMSISSISSTDTEDKDNTRNEESDDEELLSNVTPYQDEPHFSVTMISRLEVF